ncbi:hypothetical protein [Gemmata sp.]|uniref:hypothetical protein n=1 Tax=Gemmata sp. TaxID=1914242 RepID=UPI003F702F88
MRAIVTTRCHRLADALGDLKVKVRTALATELAHAVGTAVRDVLAAALVDRLVAPPRAGAARAPAARSTVRRGDADADREFDAWGDPRDAWDDPDADDRPRAPARSARGEPEEDDPVPTVPAAAAVAVGVNVGRWWLARHGTVPAAVGLGVLAAGLGLAGGPVARAALAVLAAAADVLAAETALARTGPS